MKKNHTTTNSRQVMAMLECSKEIFHELKWSQRLMVDTLFTLAFRIRCDLDSSWQVFLPWHEMEDSRGPSDARRNKHRILTALAMFEKQTEDSGAGFVISGLKLSTLRQLTLLERGLKLFLPWRGILPPGTWEAFLAYCRPNAALHSMCQRLEGGK
jgi:hypothetical protein